MPKYFKRIGSKGHYKYFYTKEDWERRNKNTKNKRDKKSTLTRKHIDVLDKYIKDISKKANQFDEKTRIKIMKEITEGKMTPSQLRLKLKKISDKLPNVDLKQITRSELNARKLATESKMSKKDFPEYYNYKNLIRKKISEKHAGFGGWNKDIEKKWDKKIENAAKRAKKEVESKFGPYSFDILTLPFEKIKENAWQI